MNMMMHHHRKHTTRRSATALLSIGIIASLCIVKLVQFQFNPSSSSSSSFLRRYLLLIDDLPTDNILSFHEDHNYYSIENDDGDYLAATKRAFDDDDDDDDELLASLAPNQYQYEVQPYTLQDAIQETTMFRKTFCLLIYDPPTDAFIALYNQRAKWAPIDKKKLGDILRQFTYMLRQTFPDRFQGSNSNELVLPIGAGDYPRVITKELPYTNVGVAPVLFFGSVFENRNVYTNMIAMPLPEEHHLNCFSEWVVSKKRKVCDLLQSSSGGGGSGGLVFGEENELKWDDLIPQLIWRGSDYGYLQTLSITAQGTPRFIRPDQDKFVVGTSDKSKRINAVQALMGQIDTLLPRWKGVALTADAELKTGGEGSTIDNKSKSLPWANMKLTNFQKRPTIGSAMYSKWESIGVATGESMTMLELAKYKYHIDLGGAGGTTWTGTIEKLAMPGLLFHHMTPTKDYIHDQLKPWKHYIPVSTNLQDLKSKYDWAEAYPYEAKRIADAGTEFMRYLGTPQGFEEMFQSSFVEPMRRVIEAYQPVATTTHDEDAGVVASSSSWRDVLESMGDENPLVEGMVCTGYQGLNSCGDATKVEILVE